jgi:hypothetical protein
VSHLRNFPSVFYDNFRSVLNLNTYGSVAQDYLQSAGVITMNIIALLKNQRRRGPQLLNTPKSSSLDISALPVELCSLIIEHVVLQYLGDARLQCRELANILKTRLVCRQCTRFTTRGGRLMINRALR